MPHVWIRYQMRSRASSSDMSVVHSNIQMALLVMWTKVLKIVVTVLIAGIDIAKTVKKTS